MKRRIKKKNQNYISYNIVYIILLFCYEYLILLFVELHVLCVPTAEITLKKNVSYNSTSR